MSSNIKVNRICMHCGQEFIARTTVTKYCGGHCAKRAYKSRIKEEKIQRSKQETEVVRISSAAHSKFQEYLTVNEAAQMLKCDPRTIQKMIHSGRLKAINLSIRKTRILKKDIDLFFTDSVEQQVSVKLERDMDKPFIPTKANCYTIGEILENYNISEATLARVIEKRNIVKYKLGRFVLVPKDKIQIYLRKYVPIEYVVKL